MKKIVYIGTSLDGYIAKKDGDIDWLVQFQNEEVEVSFTEFISNIDAIIIGRGTFEKVLAFPTWPYEKKVFVLSNSIKQIPGFLRGKATIVAMKPTELLSHLSNESYKNVYVDGGKVIQSFLQEDCIDEMIITRVPLLIGSGIPLFGHLDNDLQFEHVQTNVYSNGLVKSHYKRKRK